MHLTWNNTFTILEAMLEINQEQIAELLGVSASTISRLKDGKTKKFTSVKHEDIYRCLLDPANEKCPKHGETENYMLGLIKEEIISAGCKHALDDIWKEEDFKTFAKKMLKRTQNPRPSIERSKTSKSIEERNCNNKSYVELEVTPEEIIVYPRVETFDVLHNKKVQEPESSETEAASLEGLNYFHLDEGSARQMASTFKDAIYAYERGSIFEHYAYIDIPTKDESLAEILTKDILIPFTDKKDEPIYQKIGDFVETIRNYEACRDFKELEAVVRDLKHTLYELLHELKDICRAYDDPEDDIIDDFVMP